MSNLENAAETVYATGGKGNGRLLGWDGNRTSTFSMQDALIYPESIAAVSGVAVSTGVKTIYKSGEKLKVVAGTSGKNKVVLSQTPKTNTVLLYKSVNGRMGAEITPVTVTTKDAEFAQAEAAIDSEVLAFYQYDTGATAQTMTISADKFPGFYMITGDVLVKDSDTGVEQPMQIIVWKAKVNPGFTLTMEAAGDPSVFDFSVDVFQPDQSNKKMIEFVKY